MLAIRLEKELEEQIDLLAKAKQSNRSAVVREAVIRYLEDNEDLELARQALAQTKGPKRTNGSLIWPPRSGRGKCAARVLVQA